MTEQRSNRSFLRVAGPAVVVNGLVLTVVGMGSFFSAFGSAGMPSNFWMAFIGLPLMVIGVTMTGVGYLGVATRYVAGEVTPTIRDTLGALGVTTAEACPSCGATNDADARFCDGCGAALPAA